LTLQDLGWDAFFADAFEPYAGRESIPARVVARHHGPCELLCELGRLGGMPSGKLARAELPVVGDWVAARPLPGERRALVEAVLPRRTAFRRKEAWRRTAEQVVAANVDTVFVVSSANRDFNVRRLERYLAVAWESGAWPVVLLSKADLAGDIEPYRIAAEGVAPGVDVLAVSVVTGEGLDAVRAQLGPGRTVVFTGSSGVGKSSIVNALAGEPLLTTAAIREDDARGRHTTTRRQLIRLANGLLIDTPGLRELGVLDGDGVSTAFDDIERLGTACRFSDCRHLSEPGCAVRAAIGAGTIDRSRFDAWRKLEREAERAAIATDALARRAERKRWTSIQKSVGIHARLKYGAER